MPTEEQIAEAMRLEPGSDEFKRLLLNIAKDSDHPNDVVIARILRRELGEEPSEPAPLNITEEAANVWEAWNGGIISLPNAMMRLRAALEDADIPISKPGPDLVNRVKAWYWGRRRVKELQEESEDSDGT